MFTVNVVVEDVNDTRSIGIFEDAKKEDLVNITNEVLKNGVTLEGREFFPPHRIIKIVVKEV